MPTVAIIQALLAFATQVPSLVEAGQTVIKLLQEGRDPTPEEQALFDKALADAEAAIPKE